MSKHSHSFPPRLVSPRRVRQLGLLAAAICAFVAHAPAALLVHVKYDGSQATNAGTLGTAADGTLTGGAVFTNDAVLGGGAVYFDATASNFVAHGNSPVGGATNRTVSIWTKNTQVATDGQRSLLGFGSTAGSPNGSKMDFDLDASAGSAGVGRIEIGVNGGRTAPTYTAPAANSNQWTLVTFTWDAARGTGMNGGRFLINGNFVYAPGAATPVIDTLSDGTSAFNVGKSANTVTPLQYFTGLLDDVAVWNEALSDTEVLAMYQVATNAALQYDAGQFDQLRALHLAGSGSVTIGPRTWTYATNLLSTAGLSSTAAGLVLVLNTTNRTGVAAWEAVAPVILTQPASSTNVVGTSVTLTNFALGAQPLGFQWYQSNAPVAGATSQTLTRNPLAFTHAGPYFVVVTNLYGATTSSVATLTVLGNTPPSITTQPTNVTVIKGQPATLFAVADGSPPMSFQWRKNGTPVGGATTNSYTLASTVYADAGNWDLVVTNNFGSVTSAVAVLTVLDVTAPVIANATNITVPPAGPAGTVVSLAHVTATDDKDGPVSVTLQPPSGATFPPGVTVVKATATDSGANTATAYFTVSVLATVALQTNWMDTFTVSAQSNDINFEYNSPGRQAGILAPIRWSEPIGFDQFGNFDAQSSVDNGGTYPGTVWFAPVSPTPNLLWSSPAREFVESASYAIEFEVKPPTGPAGNSWAGFSWGTPTPLRGPDISGVGPIGGMGLLFRTTSTTNEIAIWQGGTVIHRGYPFYQGTGLAPLPPPPFTFRVEVSASAIGDGSPALVRAYVNGTPIRLSDQTTNSFVWVKTNGFGGGYFTLSAFSQTGGQQDTTFDNVKVLAVPSIWPSRPAITAIAGRSNQTFSVTVPPSLVATSTVSVVISNANPAAATLVGEAGGLTTLTFTAGGTNRQSVTVVGQAAGGTTFTLSTTAGVPIGGRPVAVEVLGTPLNFANPGFEEPPIPGLPGYGSVPGWSVSDPNYVGVSPNLNIGGSLANNSRSADGGHVGLLRALPNQFIYEQVIATTVSNLSVGQKYELSFAANARAGASTARMGVELDGTLVLDARVTPVDNAVVADYKPVGIVFTAPASTISLAISNQSIGTTEAMLFVDDFAVKPLNPGKWSIAPWTGDADSGIWSTNTYTHAYNFGTTTNATLNGVLFTGVGGGNPAVAGQFVTAGYPNALVNGNVGNNNLTGESFKLAGNFIYNSAFPSLTVQGLTPGATYRLTLFGVGWSDTNPGQRVCTWSGGGESLTVNLNTYAQGNGLLLHYDYVATGTNETITGRVLGSDTYHTFAFANQFVAAPVVAPELRISLVAGPQVRVAWDASVTGFTLQSAPEVTGPYTDVGITPTVEGADQVVYQTPSGKRFYRLFKP